MNDKQLEDLEVLAFTCKNAFNCLVCSRLKTCEDMTKATGTDIYGVLKALRMLGIMEKQKS